jgi:hypothetical protein
MRVYIAATSLLLEKLILDGSIEIDHAYAVTDGLREWYSGDEEELEYVATMAAARESIDLISEPALLRRVVLAADLDAGLIRGSAESDHHRARVQVATELPMAVIAAALVDGQDAEADLSLALAALPRASTDEDARFAIDQAQSHELLWFAAQELPFIF